MPVSAGDLAGFISGLICVWLTTRGNIWNFPVGILNSAILGLVFLQQRLFADASLQIVFIVLSALGWWKWLRQGIGQESSPVFETSPREQLLLGAITVIVTLALWRVLVLLKGACPPVDALITALSLAAQWQLNKRQVSSWLWWIVVDLISIPLYISRDLPLIAALYAVFLLLCLQGWRRWCSLAPATMRQAAI
ncbi:nicotinamide riboside transporter PnuC [Chitinimonas sp.]|uniref:nicotinamide riboside transporter PnuC n=1 Tax=Chitinimonas sp. TaxID=1934313 RepID=UPI0035B4F703